MKTVVCFGDSNTYGYNPSQNGRRYPRNIRWTGLLSQKLGPDFHIIEEGLNGRTTGFDDNIEPYRNACNYIIPCIMSHTPIDLLIIMLGTNDTKERYHLSAKEIIYSLEELIRKVLNHFHWSDQKPEILLVSPVPLKDKLVDDEFSLASIEKSKALPELYETLAIEYGIHYLSASQFIISLGCDHIHLSPENHTELADVLAAKIQNILA